MERLSRQFILSEALGILGNICSFEQLFYIKQLSRWVSPAEGFRICDNKLISVYTNRWFLCNGEK